MASRRVPDLEAVGGVITTAKSEAGDMVRTDAGLLALLAVPVTARGSMEGAEFLEAINAPSPDSADRSRGDCDGSDSRIRHSSHCRDRFAAHGAAGKDNRSGHAAGSGAELDFLR
jgi:hypothetical protein